MPVLEEDLTQLHDYKLAKKGVNLHVSRNDLEDEEALTTENLYWRNGIIKRFGSVVFGDSSGFNGSRTIDALHPFYKKSGTRVLMGATSDSKRLIYDGATWGETVSSVTAGGIPRISTWGALGRAYYADGVNFPSYYDTSWNAVTAFGAVLVKQFLSYQDRLLYISNTTADRGGVGWTDPYDDTVIIPPSTTGVIPDTKLFGMIIHAATADDVGLRSTVLLAGANGMHILSGSDMRTPSTVGNYQVDSLASRVGCNAPQTMTWTPAGTMWLGTDKMVYLLPFNSLTPIPVGRKIVSTADSIYGLESIPVAQLPNCSGIYHDGFYKLSIPNINGSFNSVQWWLDVERIDRDANRFYGPWYGPMTGMKAGAMMVLDGPGDNGQLIFGTSDPAVGENKIFEAGAIGVYTEVASNFSVAAVGVSSSEATPMAIAYQTFFNALSSSLLNADIHQIEFEMLAVPGTYNIDYFDTTGKAKPSELLSVSGGSLAHWGELSWSEFDWNSFTVSRFLQPVNPALQIRFLSLLIKNTSDGQFELFAIRVEEQLQQSPVAT